VRLRVCGTGGAAVALALALMPGTLRAQTAMVPALPQYAVLGLTGVAVHRGSRVLAGAVGAVQGTVVVDGAARVTNVVAGPRIRLGRAADTGTLFCHLVSGPPTLPSCNAFTDPLVDPALLVPVAVLPGTTDFRLPPHTGTAPMPAGSFRNVRIGTGSVLQLAGGAYAMRSLRIGRDARLVCASDCRIGVLGAVRLGRGAEFGSASPARASTVRVDLAATGPSAFVARRRANVSATIFVPAGDVVLGPLGAYRGAFIGRFVAVGPSATVRGDSAL
jgi:hypothetical protein